MTYEVDISPAAERQIKRLPHAVQHRVLNRIELLADNPHPENALKLTGTKDLFRIREGDYRIIYRIQDEVLLVLVVKVAHRREVYDRMDEL